MVQTPSRMNTLLGQVVQLSQCEAVKELAKHKDILTDTLSLDCTSQENQCVCSSNFEYFRKPEHVLQCIEKGKCFHCQRYRAMHRKYDIVTASTNLLLVAAALGKLEVLKYLHQHSGSLESKTGLFELRSLHLAIANGHFHIFCYLLSQKVDVNAIALSHGTTYSPLMMAVIYKQEDMVRHLLLTKDIDLHYRNSLSQSSVLFAVRNNSLELVEMLLGTEMALLDARLHKNYLRKLHHPFSVLEAIKQDNAKFLEILLENRTKVNYVYRGYYNQTTATTVAVLSNAHKCLQKLLYYGADYDFDDIETITALGWAKCLKWSESLTTLQQEIYGTCDLHDNNDDIVENRLTNSDEENSNQERSCLCEAKEKFLTDCSDFVYDDPESHPMIAIWSYVQWMEVSSTLQRLVAVGYDVNYQDELGRSSLHMAVEEQNVPGLRTLIELGANPNLTDACSATPFWHAVFWEKESIVKELLFANVDVECVAKEDAYKIGLPWASNDPSFEDEEIVFSETLVSTLEIAARKNFCYITHLLLESGHSIRTEEIQELLSQNCVKSDVRKLLHNHISEPRSLLNSSRNFIRKLTGRKIHQFVLELDIPQRLKDCLLLRDLFDLKIEPEYGNL